MKGHKTILATAYAINPYKGSEDGMGWNFICQIARFNKVIAITRENNRPHIESYMAQYPNEIHENIRFLYFDLPYWMRFWKKGGRGALLYFWLWQKMIVGFIKRQKLSYDIVHNLNFHSDWMPSYLWKLGKPFVWGPIGHHPLIPTQYLKLYKRKYWIKDRLTWLIKTAFWKNSRALKKSIKRAHYTFSMNTSIAQVLPVDRKKEIRLPSVASEDFGYNPKMKNEKFTIISAGRLVPLKGFDLSILGFARFLKGLPDQEKELCELHIVGSGPELRFYKKLCQEHRIIGHVIFTEWMDRQDLIECYRQSSLFLFPSHEGAGMVVSEALSFGLPVICLDNVGPGEFIDDSCGITVGIKSYDDTVSDIANSIEKVYKNSELRASMGKKARQRFIEKFHWDRRGDILKETYAKIA